MQKFSRVGHVLASAGAAVGVANLIIFPYRVHSFGGGAYVVAFVSFTLLMGIPLMILETALGKRSSGEDALNAFRGPDDGPGWAWIARLGILTTIMVASFYLVLAGWTLDYIWQYATDYETVCNLESPAGDTFGAVTSTRTRALFFTGLFTVLTGWIASRQLKAGIERLSLLAMPALGLLIAFLVISLPVLQPGKVDYSRVLRFDWNRLFSVTDKGELGVLHALGQAFFSLALGATSMLTFATHLPRETDIVQSARRIVHIDTIVAVLGAILVVPLMGNVTGKIHEGAPLVFINLVDVFKGYETAGRLVGFSFFLLLGVAVLTSAVSLFEPALRVLEVSYGFSRGRAGLGVALLVFALAVPVVISFSPEGPEWLRNFGGMGDGDTDPSMGYFNFLLEWFGSISLLIGSLLLCYYLLRRWTLSGLFAELRFGDVPLSAGRERWLTMVFRFIAPCVRVVAA